MLETNNKFSRHLISTWLLCLIGKSHPLSVHLTNFGICSIHEEKEVGGLQK